jgi:hypothetical protein
MCDLMADFRDHKELMLNVVSTLAKVSFEAQVRTRLNAKPEYLEHLCTLLTNDEESENDARATSESGLCCDKTSFFPDDNVRWPTVFLVATFPFRLLFVLFFQTEP